MSEQPTREVIVRVHEGDDGWLWSEVLDLPGCFASGRTLDELRDALEEAIALYVSDDPDARPGKGPAPDDAPRPSMRVGEMRVTVAS
jgi:predicted RNase H-like HicB family nuclease